MTRKTLLILALALGIPSCGGDPKQVSQPAADTSQEIKEAGRAVGQEVDDDAEDVKDDTKKAADKVDDKLDDED